jgi:hypothetical protein
LSPTPFLSLFKASRALWGINLSYFLEGVTYFGMLGLLEKPVTEEMLSGKIAEALGLT